MKGLCIVFFYVLTIILTFSKATAQTNGVGKLQQQLNDHALAKGKGPDTAYVNSLNQLSRAYYGVNADSAFHYARKALQYSEMTDYQKGQAESWRMIGNTSEMIGDYQGMLSAYHHSKSIAQRIGNAPLIAKVNLNIALFYRQMGEYDEARRQAGGDSIISDIDADSTERAYQLAHLADLALHNKNYDKALGYANRALQMSVAMHDSLAFASFNNDIARIMTAKGDYPEAHQRFHRSLDFYRRTHDRLGETETSLFLADAYFRQKDYRQSMQHAQAALDMARQLNRKKEIKESAKILSDNYEALHDFANAFSYGRLFKDYSDSLFDERLAKQAFALEARYEYERKEDSIRDEAVQKDLIRVQHDRTHTEQIVFAVVVIICLAIVAFILMRSRIASRKANELLTTKNQEIEQQKEAMEHQAVQLLLNNQQKDKLFSIIAHDLKGPLNSLKGLMDLLKENKLPESEIRSMMAELSRNVGHSSELVSNLLFWASSQLDGIVLNPVEIKVCQLVQDLLNLFVRQAEEKKIAFVNHIAPSVTAYADLDMTQVVLRNLIGNAIKFCRPGDTITLSSHTNNGVVDICVSDTGIGIKEELLEKIRRKESVTTYGTAKEKGTGLGMLLCREFAEANNGDFRIESQWGKGSQFYFTIPVAASSSSISV